jgi:hypothetical protein
MRGAPAGGLTAAAPAGAARTSLEHARTQAAVKADFDRPAGGYPRPRQTQLDVEAAK